MHERENVLKEWLFDILGQKEYTLKPLFGDASFRRYYRLECEGVTRVIMDAPPDKEKDLEAFIHMSHTLANAGICTPEILAQDLQQGFLLLTDFGDRLLLAALNTDTVDKYYEKAIQTLYQIQACPINDPGLPIFNKALMISEMNLCTEWFFTAYLSLQLEKSEHNLFLSSIEWIAEEVAKQPLVFTHKDYHSRNLMLINDQTFGVIDFQDAVQGPVTYDLVSLLKDCYISWPRTKILEWVAFFHKQHPLAQDYSLSEFIRAFDLCGLQRHLKVLGIFCRLKIRDNKDGYIKDLPLTLRYVLECTEIYDELRALYDLFQKRVYLP